LGSGVFSGYPPGLDVSVARRVRHFLNCAAAPDKT
jgi:hypothetical protein